MTGDQDALPAPGESKPYWGAFKVWSRILKERNDFNVLLGDTIYSDTEVPGYTSRNVATSVKKKWAKYRINLGQRPWARIRGATAYYAHWDDHEFINDFSPRENEFPLGVGTFRVSGRKLYTRGVRAFKDYNPVTYSKRSGIYRRFRWGKNLEVFFLDMRSFRSRNADYQGNCDNPQTGEPDLAPTAPQSTRNLFSVLAPSLSEPVSQQCLDRINDPDRTMLGARQFSRFKKAIRNSTATWKVIFNELPIQQYYALPYDRWEGFEAERQKMLKFLQANVENVVFLTADVHASLVNDARLKTLEPGGPVNSGILDIVTGPIATANYSIEINDATGSEASAGALYAAFFKPEPPSGVGMDCASLTTDSYAQVTATKRKLTVELNDAAGNPVPDTPDGSPGPPCEPVVLTAE
jgi:phosphodiesterase/alkaline phosphatase D-like protein